MTRGNRRAPPGAGRRGYKCPSCGVHLLERQLATHPCFDRRARPRPGQAEREPSNGTFGRADSPLARSVHPRRR